MGSKQDDWSEENKNPEDCTLINDLNFSKVLLLFQLAHASVGMSSAFLINTQLSSLPTVSLSKNIFSRQTRTGT